MADKCGCRRSKARSVRRTSRHGGIDLRQLLIDAALGVGLLVAVAIVFALDKRSDPSSANGDGGNDDLEAVVVDGDDPEVGSDRRLQLAVTPPEYDDVGKLLDTLGPGYRYTTIPMDALLDPKRLARYDVVFFSCGGSPREWLEERLRASERGAQGVYRAKDEIVRKIRQSLRQFVGRGGTLYASDLQFDHLAAAFPEFVDKLRMGRGVVQTVQAEVVEPGLRKRIGKSIELDFDMPSWRPAAFRGPDVTTYMRGSYELRQGGTATGPLLVTFPYQEGSVVFTSFHNEAQNSEMELELLRYLVFSAVTAKEEGQIRKTMVSGGFSPSQRSLLSASSQSRPVEETYECRKSGPLQFVLGFEDQGAKLRLTVAGPDGYQAEKTGSERFTIEVPKAAAGQWTYTITPIEIPYQNFPYILTIGEKQ